MADPLKLQSPLERADAMVLTVGPLCCSRSNRVPPTSSAYLNLKRQAYPRAPVLQHIYGATTLLQLPSARPCASPSKGRRCIMASGAPLISFPDPVNIVRFDTTARLPPLTPSTIISGLPPPPPPASGSQLHEADQRLKGIAERWRLPWSVFEPWSQTGISFSNGLHGGRVDTDRFVAISSFNTVHFMLDDLFFDAPDESALKEYGISGSVCESPDTIKAFFKHLYSLFRQQAPLPGSLTPIEGIIWELGHDMRRLSTPAWFTKFAYTLMEHQEGSIASHADDRVAGDRRRYESNLDNSRLETFSQMRVRNSGGRWVMMLVELACNVFLSDKFRAHPTVQQLTDAAALHCTYVNDLFSYPKEVLEKPSNVRNLVVLLMDHSHSRDGQSASSGSGLPQAAWEAVNLIMSLAHMATELEQQQFDLADTEPEAIALRTYINGLKSAMTGTFYWHTMAKRYRHPDSVFPELRGNVTN